MNQARRNYIDSCEISRIQTFTLGGYLQKTAIEGRKRDLPVVICLHGGPGTPIPFSVGCRGLFPDLTDRAIMVYWDQLGCGCNNFPIDDGFTLDSFTAMTEDLISEIKKLFPENKIYLLGMSWGSILAAQAAREMPEAVAGVLVYGQILKNLFFCDEVFDALAASSAPEKVKKKVEEIKAAGIPETPETLRKTMRVFAGYLRKYTETYFSRSEKNSSSGDMVKGLLTSPDYRLRDLIAIVKNGYAKNDSLWRELLKLDLTSVFSEVRIPYYIVQGAKDVVASTKTISGFVAASGRENLHCRVIEGAGHFPTQKAMDALFGCLTELIGG